MSSEPHSLESFDALADDGARDAAMMPALGWEWVITGHTMGSSEPIYRWRRYNKVNGGVGQTLAALAYYTGGVADPFANWDLLAEVCRALDIFALDRNAAFASWNVGRGASGMAKGEYHHAPTLHRAACRALVAAGLVPREKEAPDAQEAP